MSNQELHYLTIAELAPLLRDKKVSPVELLQAFLERIHALDGTFHSFITLMEESAVREAEQSERALASGDYRGPLHGIPIGLKDLYYTKGVVTTAGSPILGDFVPGEDATTVTKLKEAGGIILGKLNMHPFAYGAIGINPDYGTPPNPWDKERIPGGSSSGAGVALMAGMLPAATGSDTGGSIRIPASICGVVGIKPTYGRVSKHGVVPLSWSLDHAGPMARSVEDCAVLLQAMAGHDPKDPGSREIPVPDYVAEMKRPVKGLKAGLPRKEFFVRLQQGVSDAVEKAIETLEGMGVEVHEVDVPSMDDAVAISLGILGPEVAAYHRKWIEERPGDYVPQVLTRIKSGMFVPAVDYIKSHQARAKFTQGYLDAMNDLDILITPTEQLTAPKMEESRVTIDGVEETTQNLMLWHNRPFNITGFPAISVPCGFDDKGLPVGLQIVGKPFQEGTVLQAAYAYEQATPWHEKRPQL